MNGGGIVWVGEHSPAVDVVAASSSDGGRGADLAVVLQLLLRPTCKVEEEGGTIRGQSHLSSETFSDRLVSKDYIGCSFMFGHESYSVFESFEDNAA